MTLISFFKMGSNVKNLNVFLKKIIQKFCLVFYVYLTFTRWFNRCTSSIIEIKKLDYVNLNQN